jgi:hypothetical protein
MADKLNVKFGGDKEFLSHPEGAHPMTCVDVLDFGKTVQHIQVTTKIMHKCMLVFQSEECNPETGAPFLVSQEFTVSLFSGGHLRPFLEAWRGKKYTQAEEDAGEIPLHKMVGASGLAQITHGKSKAGRTYANISSIMRLPKGMEPPTLGKYERPEWLEKKKAAYMEEYARHLATEIPAGGAGPSAPGAEYPPLPEDDDDDLPF